MTADTTTSLQYFLQDFIAPMQQSFSKRTVLRDELTRNTRRSNFSGLQVRVPLMLNLKQGTGGFAETGTINVARQINDTAAYIKMARVGHPIEVSLDVIQAVERNNFAYAGDALKLEMDAAEDALSRVENEMLFGSGTGLIAAFTAGATSATQTVGTSANFYQLYPGRIVDLQNRSTGATVSLARTILSSDPVAGTVTFDSSVTAATTDGIYIEGTFGNAVQGLQQPFATTGTFQGVNMASVLQFRATEGRATQSAADLSMPIMDAAWRRVTSASGKSPDFWVGDPAAIDKFGQGLISQFRWEPKITRLQTGWEGIDYRGTPLIPDFDAPAGSLYGINKTALTMYGYSNGPEWDKQTGSMFQRFTRTAPVEAWLLDFLQLGFHQPGAITRLTSLNQASG